MTRGRGFSLIELMVALSILVILFVLAMPSYSTWVADGNIRSAAESIAAGMRFAYAQAIKENRQMEFVLNPTVGTGGWQVNPVGGAAIRQEYFNEGGKYAAPVPGPSGATKITFTAIGTINPTNADTTPILTIVTVNSAASIANARPLVVLVGNGRTGIKICDPAVTVTTSPKFCTT